MSPPCRSSYTCLALRTNGSHPRSEAQLFGVTSIWRSFSDVEHQQPVFARADTVGAPYEGSITRAQLAARTKQLKEMPGDWNFDEVEEFVSRLQRERVRATAINCWHMADHESMAMWKLYSPDGRGVAIRSSVDRLLKCFPDGDLRDFPDPARRLQPTADMTKKDDHGLPLALAVEFGTVAYADYIDPDADAQPDFWVDAVFLKRKSFEFRAAAFGLAVDQDGRTTLNRMLFPNGGSRVPVDLDVYSSNGDTFRQQRRSGSRRSSLIARGASAGRFRWFSPALMSIPSTERLKADPPGACAARSPYRRAVGAARTRAVTPIRDHPAMRDEPRLQPDSQLHCPYCRRWHDVIAIHTSGTGYTIAMRYFVCRGAHYYAGQDGGMVRFPMRAQATRADV